MTIAFLLLFFLAYAAFLATFIDNDGYGRLPAFRHPPRSHHADMFERRELV
jgi:hypothetical protein